MGCITFEFILWLLYGYDAIDNLYQEIYATATGSKEIQYFELGYGEARVHGVVTKWIEHMRTHDPECQKVSAIHDLLKLVRKKLLVVDLPPRRESARNNGQLAGGPQLQPDRLYRATAEDLRKSLADIIRELENEDYAFTRTSRKGVKPPGRSPKQLFSNVGRYPGTHKTSMTRKLNSTRATNRDYSLPALDEWQFPVDEAFADKVLSRLGDKAFNPRLSTAATLCNRCKSRNFWKGGFYIEEKTAILFQRSQTCDLCKMMWSAHRKSEGVKNPKVRFERDGSTFKISGHDSLPALSLLRSIGEPLSHYIIVTNKGLLQQLTQLNQGYEPLHQFNLAFQSFCGPVRPTFFV